MITRIFLKNWKSHLNSEFRFSEGVNALIGIMGSGKSSVMQGVSFALFGMFPELQNKKIHLDDLIMKKPQYKNTAEVCLEFVSNGKVYTIKRVIERGKGTTHAEIRENGKLLDVNPKNVTETVERILQIDYDLFSKAVYSEQNALDYFLRIPKGKRTEQIDRMLQLDKFEHAREECVKIANRVEAEIQEKIRIIKDIESEGLQEKKEKYEKEMEAIEKELRKLKMEMEDILHEKERLQSIIEKIREKENKYHELKIELQGLLSGIEHIEMELKRRFQGISLEEIEVEIEKTDGTIRKAESEMSEIEGLVQTFRERIASFQTQIKSLEKEIFRLQALGSKCPVCESEITVEKKKKLIEERKEKQMGLNKELESLKKSLEKKEEERKNIERKIKEEIAKKERLLSIKRDLESIPELNERKERYKKKMEEIRKEIQEIERELNTLEKSRVEKEFQEIIGREKGIQQKILSLQEWEKDKKMIIKELESRLNKLKEYKKETKIKEIISKELRIFERVLKQTQTRLREEFLHSINQIMKNVWKRLYPYTDFKEVRLNIDQDYVLQLRGTEGWISVDSASGGERSMACLALRIAFSLAFLPNLKWLILDEPTHNLDANAINQFVQALRDNLGGLVEQVFLITHDERVSEGIQGSLYRLERNKDENEPTRVIGETPE